MAPYLSKPQHRAQVVLGQPQLLLSVPR
eukprot:COSAG03_NODE_13472_length_501_cov_76.097015_2_plen_27_part_01